MKLAVLVAVATLVGCGTTTPQLGPSPGPEVVKEQSQPQSPVPSEAELGIPYYPGANPLSGQNTSTLVDGQFATRDSIDKVVSFYKGQIRGAVATGDKNESLIEFQIGDDKATISLHRDQRAGVTLISVNHHR